MFYLREKLHMEKQTKHIFHLKKDNNKGVRKSFCIASIDFYRVKKHSRAWFYRFLFELKSSIFGWFLKSVEWP